MRSTEYFSSASYVDSASWLVTRRLPRTAVRPSRRPCLGQAGVGEQPAGRGALGAGQRDEQVLGGDVVVLHRARRGRARRRARGSARPRRPAAARCAPLARGSAASAASARASRAAASTPALVTRVRAVPSLVAQQRDEQVDGLGGGVAGRGRGELGGLDRLAAAGGELVGAELAHGGLLVWSRSNLSASRSTFVSVINPPEVESCSCANSDRVSDSTSTAVPPAVRRLDAGTRTQRTRQWAGDVGTDAPSQRSEHGVNVTAPSSPRPKRVVVIDDTEDLRELLGLALTRGGFEIVAEAADGEAGIEVVREHRPDVVLLDLAMPVMDGIEALPAIRRLVPNAKVIVLSGFGAQQMSARAVAEGADGYVQKGAPLSSILDYVRSVCEAPAGRNARTLSVVPNEGSGVDALPADRLDDPRPGSSLDDSGRPGTSLGEAGRPAPGGSAHGRSSTWEALNMAPFGVVELADEPLFRVMSTNVVGQRLLGATKPGSPLAMSAPELASLVSYHRLDVGRLLRGRARGRPVPAPRCAAPAGRSWSTSTPRRRTSACCAAPSPRPRSEIRGPGRGAERHRRDDRGRGPPARRLGPGERENLMASVARQTRILDGITADLLTAAQIQRGTLRVDMAGDRPGRLARRVAAEHDDVARGGRGRPHGARRRRAAGAGAQQPAGQRPPARRRAGRGARGGCRRPGHDRGQRRGQRRPGRLRGPPVRRVRPRHRHHRRHRPGPLRRAHAWRRR